MATRTPIAPPILCDRDRSSGLRFLVDTGAQVSVLPVSRLHFNLLVDMTKGRLVDSVTRLLLMAC